jgi:hypothetical protein
MPGLDGTEAIADDELLYRRVPHSTGWYDGTRLDRMAFNPRPDDTTGISLFRAKYKSVEEAARGREGKQYFVAVLRAGDLRQNGIDIRPAPLEDDPGHAEITTLTYQNRKTATARQQMAMLAGRLCLRVEGPFPTSSNK